MKNRNFFGVSIFFLADTVGVGGGGVLLNSNAKSTPPEPTDKMSKKKIKKKQCQEIDHFQFFRQNGPKQACPETT